ncbi:ArsR/SmtB family transcription factor [Halorubrum sp. DTA98]|uniref:ArsR/SmtB family transcription factor n=1 Tax=Halorubrum sp. DTA98 TaxID=3402163 RepID=UPI003AADE33A
MSRLLPSLPDTSPDDREPRIVGVDDDEADELLAALGSETARTVLSTLHEEPATTSEIADEIDTSLQNVQYHLGRLSEAELVDVVDTAYSEKGREMNVYAPTDEPLVLFAGPPTDSTGIKAALKRLLGGYGILGLAGLAAQQLYSVGTPGATDDAAPAADDGDAEPGMAADDDAAEADSMDAEADAEPTPEPEVEDAEVAEDGIGRFVETLVDGIEALADHAVTVLEPGVVLFLVAAIVFTVAWAYRYRDELRRLR